MHRNSLQSQTCVTCDKIIHFKCIKTAAPIVCTVCYLLSLQPFHHSSDPLFPSFTNSSSPSINHLEPSFITHTDSTISNHNNTTANPPSGFLKNLIPELQQEQKNRLKVIHLNIRSIYQNLDQLKCLLATHNYTPDIIMLTETWINKNKKTQKLSSISLPNYTLISSDRNFSRGGG